jgi:hypothetical protein
MFERRKQRVNNGGRIARHCREENRKLAPRFASLASPWCAAPAENGESQAKDAALHARMPLYLSAQIVFPFFTKLLTPLHEFS